jgi:hypothetical protein
MRRAPLSQVPTTLAPGGKLCWVGMISSTKRAVDIRWAMSAFNCSQGLAWTCVQSAASNPPTCNQRFAWLNTGRWRGLPTKGVRARRWFRSVMVRR